MPTLRQTMGSRRANPENRKPAYTQVLPKDAPPQTRNLHAKNKSPRTKSKNINKMIFKSFQQKPTKRILPHGDFILLLQVFAAYPKRGHIPRNPITASPQRASGLIGLLFGSPKNKEKNHYGHFITSCTPSLFGFLRFQATPYRAFGPDGRQERPHPDVHQRRDEPVQGHLPREHRAQVPPRGRHPEMPPGIGQAQRLGGSRA